MDEAVRWVSLLLSVRQEARILLVRLYRAGIGGSAVGGNGIGGNVEGGGTGGAHPRCMHMCWRPDTRWVWAGTREAHRMHACLAALTYSTLPSCSAWSYLRLQPLLRAAHSLLRSLDVSPGHAQATGLAGMLLEARARAAM